jgi:hypothetical protein
VDKYYFLVFNNTHGAMKAENYLKVQGMRITIMPTPTQITKSCGISIIIAEENLNEVKDIIDKQLIEVKGLYLKENGGYNKLI